MPVIFSNYQKRFAKLRLTISSSKQQSLPFLQEQNYKIYYQSLYVFLCLVFGVS